MILETIAYNHDRIETLTNVLILQAHNAIDAVSAEQKKYILDYVDGVADLIDKVLAAQGAAIEALAEEDNND